MEEVKVIGQMDNTIDHTFESANRVYDIGGVAPTINTCGGGGLQPKIIESVKELGFMDNGTGKHQSNTVYDENALCPNITTIQGGGTQQIKIAESQIVAMRGRNPTNPSDRTPGIETEQRLEPNTHGTCNTLTSVQKDNLVLESKGISTKGKEINVASTVLAGYERTNMTGFNADNAVMETVRIKQATKDGFIECKVGGVADLSYPNSKTRRGRVQNNGNTCPALTAENQDVCRIEKVGQISSDNSQYGTVLSENGLSSTLQAGTHGYANSCIATQYRIRKLTPKECWRLMDFSDEDFEKAAEVNSNTQLYKQAGNSIIRNVLVAILGQLIEGKEDAYRKI